VTPSQEKSSSTGDVRLCDAADRAAVTARLLESPGANSWAIQDLKVWPDATRLYYVKPRSGPVEPLSYLLETGHPGAQRSKVIVMGGTPEGVKPLLAKLPPGPWCMRETPAAIWPTITASVPKATVFWEQRMEATRASFRPAPGPGEARRLVASDAEALAEFHGAPPAAARGFLEWIQGAVLLGVWEGGNLMAIASTFVRLPEVWNLVGIATRKSARGRGFGTTVTNALTAAALEAAPLVTLTVLQDNDAARRLYTKLGYEPREDRIWIDNGAYSSPVID
jgi:ribosomal protein S18 acetylase RimI-like enzyme